MEVGHDKPYHLVCPDGRDARHSRKADHPIGMGDGPVMAGLLILTSDKTSCWTRYLSILGYFKQSLTSQGNNHL